MSLRDLDRLEILRAVENKQITQIAAGQMLKISDRQVRTLVRRLREEGPTGIISKLVGQRGNRRKSDEFKEQVLNLMRSKYQGFKPKFASEKLQQLNALTVSRETLRNWMIENHLWLVQKKKNRVHPTRPRRESFGELIQADGSPDHWFGIEYPKANATVFIDDATSRLTSLYFSPTETLNGYFHGLEEHLNQYGRPLALYTDRSSVFSSSKQQSDKIHMQKALKRLGIQSILAYSPQAKGRVERANRTLQDRLKCEFRLRGITTIEEANVYCKEFMKEYNENFSKKPMSAFDAHRSLEGYDLDRILCREEERTLNSFATFQFNNNSYQIQGISEYRRLKGKKVEVRLTRSSQMRVFLDGNEVKCLPLSQVILPEHPSPLPWKNKKPRKQGKMHPWKHRNPTENMEVAV